MNATPEQEQRRTMLVARNQAAVTDMMAAFQKFNLRCTEVMQEGDIDGGLDHCEKGIARLEGLAMTIRRLTEEV